MITFDIETGPLNIELLKEILPPWDPNSIGPHPGSFDPSSVKCGNIGGPTSDKGKAKIEEASKSHAKSVEEYEAKLAGGESAYWADRQSKAALSAVTGEVLVIGYMGNKEAIQHRGMFSEQELLMRFWSQYKVCRQSARKIIGFNCNEFDIPFLVRRSWIVGVEVPGTIYNQGKYVDSLIVDLMQLWKGPAYRDQYISLDTCCRACRLPAKPADCSGADFAAKFWNEETRDVALSYLSNDLKMTSGLASRMGVI